MVVRLCILRALHMVNVGVDALEVLVNAPADHRENAMDVLQLLDGDVWLLRVSTPDRNSLGDLVGNLFPVLVDGEEQVILDVVVQFSTGDCDACPTVVRAVVLQVQIADVNRIALSELYAVVLQLRTGDVLNGVGDKVCFAVVVVG